MNNDILKTFKNKTFKKNIIIMAVIIAGILLLYILFDYILDGLLIQSIGKMNSSFADFLVNNKSGLLFIINTILVFVIFIFMYKSYINKLNMIITSIESIFNKYDELITLPDEYKEIETKLNNIKYNIIKNESLIKESEKRKNDLIVYLAHDLKTPLTSIIGYLSLLKDESQISDVNKSKFIDISLNKAVHLENLINEFFEITRFNLQDIKLELKDIDLSMMLIQLVDEFYPLYSVKNIVCKTDIPNNIIINADGLKLARVFDNILKNAISYSEENCCINIDVEVSGTSVSIVIKNNGIKIPQNKLDDIFEKFYRLDTSRSSETGGSGLGLAIAKEIVLLHGGRIYAVSDEFTEFHVELPL